MIPGGETTCCHTPFIACNLRANELYGFLAGALIDLHVTSSQLLAVALQRYDVTCRRGRWSDSTLGASGAEPAQLADGAPAQFVAARAIGVMSGCM